jgi:hypothetical protein
MSDREPSRRRRRSPSTHTLLRAAPSFEGGSPATGSRHLLARASARGSRQACRWRARSKRRPTVALRPPPRNIRRSRPCAEFEVASQIAPNNSGAKILPRVIVTSFPSALLGTSGVDCVPSMSPTALGRARRAQRSASKTPPLAAARASAARMPGGARWSARLVPSILTLISPPPASTGRNRCHSRSRVGEAHAPRLASLGRERAARQLHGSSWVSRC